MILIIIYSTIFMMVLELIMNDLRSSSTALIGKKLPQTLIKSNKNKAGG